MPNGKNKNRKNSQNPKKKNGANPSRRKPAPGRSVPPAVAKALRHFSDSQSYLPDGHTFPSTAYRAVTRVGIAPNAFGNAALILQPSTLASCVFSAPTVTANDYPLTTTGAAANNRDYASLSAAFS